METKPDAYHGSHEYSTFSASTIFLASPDHDKNTFHKCFCFLCQLSKSLILHPVGPFRCIWDMFVMVLLIYTSIEIPFTMSFGQTNTASYVSVSVDCFLLIDIFFNFHTAYFDKYDRLRLVTNKTYIFKKYLRTWFFLDFVTCIPFQLIFDMAQVQGTQKDSTTALDYIKILRVFRLLRILKILRFLKMLRIFDTFMRQFVVREVIVVMKILKIIFGMILFAHFAACLWWFVGTATSPSWIDTHKLREGGHSTFTKYSYSWYWAVVTLFTTGYGDIVATNITEQWVCSICILVGTCFFAYFVGTLTVFITEGDKIKSFQSDKLEEAQSFCEKKKLPKELTRAVLTHIRYHCTYNYVFDENELLSLLPAYLQHDIHSYVAKQFLLQLKIFQNEYIHLSNFIIGLIAVQCKSISCNQSYKLYDVGDIAKEFYIQRTGQSLMYDKKGHLVRELTRGSVCGEYSGFLFKKRKVKIQCQTWSEFYSINVDDIRQTLDMYYPKSSHSKWNAIKRYLKTAYQNNRKHCVEINHLSENYEPRDPLLTQRSQRSVSLFYHAPPPNSTIRTHEESVHLFNNTKINETLHHIPIPPLYSDNEHDDHDEHEDHDEGTTLKPSLKRPKSYEYSLARHQNTEHAQHHHHHEDKKESEELEEHNIDRLVSRIDRNKRNSKIFDFKAMAKFQIRSNSEVRDSIIVAHAEKHRKSLGSPQLQKSNTMPKRAKTMPASQEGLLTKKEIKAIEMGVIDLKDNVKDHRSPLFSDGRDSECSFFSSFSSEFSSEDEKKQLKRKKVSIRRNFKKKAGIRRKGKAGKFGARGRAVGGTKSSNQKANHNLHSAVVSHHDRDRHMRRTRSRRNRTLPQPTFTPPLDDNNEDMPQKSTLIHNRPSFDESILLSGLNPKHNGANIRKDKDTSPKHESYRKPLAMSIHINSVTSIKNDNEGHHGTITPLTYMALIKRHSAEPPQPENAFDVCDDVD
eukprot:80845_1